MKKIKEQFKSVRFKLFITFCIFVMFLVVCLIAINRLVLENFYMYNKTKTIKEVYQKINEYYENPSLDKNLESELKKIAYKNNFDILIQADTNLIVFSTNKDLLENVEKITNMLNMPELSKGPNVIYSDENMQIRRITDNTNNLNYILLTGKLVNEYNLYIRIPIAPIEESVRISNEALILIGLLTIIVAFFAISFIIATKSTQINV